MLIIDILLIFLIITVIVTCLYLISSLRQLKISLMNIDENINQVVKKTIPVLENLAEASEKALTVIAQVERQVDEVTETLDGIRNRFNEFVYGFKSNLTPEKAGMRIISTFTNLKNGISSFLSRFRD